EVVEGEMLTMIVDQKKPVATPGDVSSNFTVSRNLNRYIFRKAVARHVGDGNFSAFVEQRFDYAHGRFNAMSAWPNALQIRERRYHANGAMSAHSQIGNVIKEDH